MNRTEAIERLLAEDGYHLVPGSTLYTTTLHTSRSGMTRHIKVVRIDGHTPHDISGLVAAATGARWHDDGGMVVGGCGMDMGFSLVYDLSRTLYPNGHLCAGERTCRSNDHSNDYGQAARQAREELALKDLDWTKVEHSVYRAQIEDVIEREGLTYRVGRMHSDGGYAISQRWL